MEQNLNIVVPKDYSQDDIFFKVQKKNHPQEKIQTFRSFTLSCGYDNKITIQNTKQVDVKYLYKILHEHGLSLTVPVNVSLNLPVEATSIDFSPQYYNGPSVWYFDWDGIRCSICYSNFRLYIRVHDLTVGLGEKIMDEITKELLKYWTSPTPSKSLAIYTTQLTPQGFKWCNYCNRLQRDMDTIYIEGSIKNKLINQLQKFLNSSHMYDRYGITWKRVHLFYGPPGSGKTSTILALASLFNKNVAKLTVTPELNSQHAEQLFQTVPDNTFLLIEDVDALFTNTSSIDFSTLLNCMDGIITKRGLVVFMTSNHLEKLDSAFIRPGRIDMILEFALPTINELRQALKVLGANYEHEHEEFLAKHGSNMSIAGLQKHLFECIMEEKKSILD